ncbi:MAG: hypothetical protein J1E31_06995 [Helicobacter sp.]|nr:hypothetical protein [Helicobacter sp.]
MHSIIHKAFIQAIQDTLGEAPKQCGSQIYEGYLSSIDLVLENGQKEVVLFVSSKSFLNTLAENLLGEVNPDDLTLKDLSQELANLTIGLSKVLAIHEGLSFNIGTPKVYGFGKIKEDKTTGLNFQLGQGNCSVFVE